MSGNYAQLKTAADAFKASSTAFQIKCAEKSTADKELAQSTAVLTEIDDEVDLRTKQLADATADLAKVTAEKAEYLALQSSLTTQKAALVAAREVISNRPIPPNPPGTGAGTLDTAEGLVVTLKGQVPALVTARDAAFTPLNTQRIKIYNDNNLLDQLLAALDAAQKNYDQNPTHPQALTDLNAARTAVDTARASIQSDTTALGPLEVTYQAAVDALALKVGEVREAENNVTNLQADYDTAYLAALEVTNKLQDYQGSDDANPDNNVVPAAPTSRIGLAETNEIQLGSVITAITPMKTAALAAQALRKADVDADTIAAKTAENAKNTASNDKDTKRKNLDGLIKIQKKIEVDAACLVLEYFLKNHDLRVASSPGVTPAEDEAVALTCPGSTIRNLVSKIKLSYSTEAQYLAMCEILTEFPIESFFDSTMDECFIELCPDEAEDVMADIRTEFGKCASKLISKYGKCGKKSSGLAWWVWVLIIVGLIVLFLLAGGGTWAVRSYRNRNSDMYDDSRR